jgi:hypothetical protein
VHKAPAFIIDAVSWHTSVEGNPETTKSVIARFNTLATFLRSRGLLVRLLPDVDKAFALRASDLTDEGLRLLKVAHDPWLKRIDHDADSRDATFLEDALVRLRQGTD